MFNLLILYRCLRLIWRSLNLSPSDSFIFKLVNKIIFLRIISLVK